MRVIHPRALDDDAGPPPSGVDIRGETVPVDDDGVFTVDDEGWLQQFASRYETDPETLVIDEPADEEGDEDGDENTQSFDEDSWLDADWQDREEQVRAGEVDDVLDTIIEIETSGNAEEAAKERLEELEE